MTVRGSDDIPNWIDNIDAVKTSPYSDSSVKVHKGFYSEYLALRDPMVHALLSQYSLHPTTKLVLTGHSSGGANMVFFAYDLLVTKSIPELDFFHLSSLFTFGVPRVGNPAFASSFVSADIPHTRVVHYRDIVPHLPYEWMGFKHTPHEIWYDSEDSSSYVECDGTGEDNNCSDQELYEWPSDHCYYIGQYICGC